MDSYQSQPRLISGRVDGVGCGGEMGEGDDNASGGCLRLIGLLIVRCGRARGDEGKAGGPRVFA